MNREQSWFLIDSEQLHAVDNMKMDADALEKMSRGILTDPILRFFEWVEPCVTFGYLLDEKKVRQWAKCEVPIHVRPTGGGAVFHNPRDLGVSLIWPRFRGWLSENPRECYRLIHAVLKSGMENIRPADPFALHARSQGGCESPARKTFSAPSRFSECFSEPVCSDVMLMGKKVIGGALRVTKKAILYQGAISLENGDDKQELKSALAAQFQAAFNVSYFSPAVL